MRFSAVILPNAANSTASSPARRALARTRAPRRGVRSQRRGPEMDRLASAAPGNSSRRSAATRGLWTATSRAVRITTRSIGQQ